MSFSPLPLPPPPTTPTWAAQPQLSCWCCLHQHEDCVFPFPVFRCPLSEQRRPEMLQRNGLLYTNPPLAGRFVYNRPFVPQLQLGVGVTLQKRPGRFPPKAGIASEHGHSLGGVRYPQLTAPFSFLKFHVLFSLVGKLHSVIHLEWQPVENNQSVINIKSCLKKILSLFIGMSSLLVYY